MKEIESKITAIYSFNEFGRLNSNDYGSHTVYYSYLNDERDYLLESYVQDNTAGDQQSKLWVK